MTRRTPLPDVCPMHQHAYKIGSECSQCWADKRRNELERNEGVQVRKAHPTKSIAISVGDVTKRGGRVNG
jgi:L-rhamnose isomerase